MYGPVPVVRALAESLNLATVGVGLDVGVPKVAQTLQRFGLPPPPAPVPAMLLGRGRRHAAGGRAAVQRARQRRLPEPAARGARGDRRRRQAAEGLPAGGDPGRLPGERLPARSHAGAGHGARHRARRARAAAAGRSWSPASPAPPRTTATAGSPASPAATWWWCGWATTTTGRPASPAPPARCRCGRTSWQASARAPGTRRCPSRSPRCTSSTTTGLRALPGCAAGPGRGACRAGQRAAARQARLRLPGHPGGSTATR